MHLRGAIVHQLSRLEPEEVRLLTTVKQVPVANVLCVEDIIRMRCVQMNKWQRIQTTHHDDVSERDRDGLLVLLGGPGEDEDGPGKV